MHRESRKNMKNTTKNSLQLTSSITSPRSPSSCNVRRARFTGRIPYIVRSMACCPSHTLLASLLQSPSSDKPQQGSMSETEWIPGGSSCTTQPIFETSLRGGLLFLLPQHKILIILENPSTRDTERRRRRRRRQRHRKTWSSRPETTTKNQQPTYRQNPCFLADTNGQHCDEDSTSLPCQNPISVARMRQAPDTQNAAQEWLRGKREPTPPFLIHPLLGHLIRFPSYIHPIHHFFFCGIQHRSQIGSSIIQLSVGGLIHSSSHIHPHHHFSFHRIQIGHYHMIAVYSIFSGQKSEIPPSKSVHGTTVFIHKGF